MFIFDFVLLESQKMVTYSHLEFCKWLLFSSLSSKLFRKYDFAVFLVDFLHKYAMNHMGSSCEIDL